MSRSGSGKSVGSSRGRTYQKRTRSGSIDSMPVTENDGYFYFFFYFFLFFLFSLCVTRFPSFLFFIFFWFSSISFSKLLCFFSFFFVSSFFCFYFSFLFSVFLIFCFSGIAVFHKEISNPSTSKIALIGSIIALSLYLIISFICFWTVVTVPLQ